MKNPIAKVDITTEVYQRIISEQMYIIEELETVIDTCCDELAKHSTKDSFQIKELIFDNLFKDMNFTKKSHKKRHII